MKYMPKEQRITKEDPEFEKRVQRDNIKFLSVNVFDIHFSFI